MTIEYVMGTEPHVEHVEPSELPRWRAEHPQAVIVHVIPDATSAEANGDTGVNATAPLR
jgi:hypothetical protein